MLRLPLSKNDVAALLDRPQWSVLEGNATFAPLDSGWRAVVHRLHPPTTKGSRYVVALIDRTGAIRYTREAGTLLEAAQTAERDVAARNALRLVRHP
jgi:hypothetical protein